MNVSIQGCALALILLVLILYSRQKKIYLNTQKLFLAEACLILLNIVVDILSVITLYQQDLFPELLVKILAKLYLVVLVAVGFVTLLYVSVDIYKKSVFHVKKLKIYTVIFVIVGIVIMMSPIECVTEEESGLVYTQGLSVSLTYIFTMLVIVDVLYHTIREKDKLNYDRHKAVILWMGMWVSGAVIQFFIPTFLVVGFMLVLGFLVLYIRLENPEMFIDRETGLYNQSAFREYVRQLYGENKNFAILSATFDYFDAKEIPKDVGNDVFIFRRTSDELVFVSENKDAIEKINENLGRKFHNIKRRVERSHIPDATLILNADDLFYFIRNVYRMNSGAMEENYILVDESLIEQMYRERDAEKLLDDAINKGRVEVFYQPIYSIEDKAFTSAEALVRIRNEEGRIIPPFEFIPVAEKTGKILELGRIVFEQVCQFIKEQNMVQLGLHYIEVNLSVVQCGDQSLADTYISIMEQYGVMAKYVNLEITESASLNSKEILLENMKALMNYGVSFSLDDFGTGQSNLNYIVDMPVNIVKFDRDMTKAYFDSGKAKYVMDAAMHMIHGMGLKIVSEGIETEYQYKVMEDLGICYIQGYYFSKPLPKKEFLDFIQNA